MKDATVNARSPENDEDRLGEQVPIPYGTGDKCTEYAFPGATKGFVTLVLEQTGAGLRLEVSDDGIGLPATLDPAGSPGTGLKLVNALVKQIKGALTIERETTGTRCVLEFPVA